MSVDSAPRRPFVVGGRGTGTPRKTDLDSLQINGAAALPRRSLVHMGRINRTWTRRHRGQATQGAKKTVASTTKSV